MFKVDIHFMTIGIGQRRVGITRKKVEDRAAIEHKRLPAIDENRAILAHGGAHYTPKVYGAFNYCEAEHGGPTGIPLVLSKADF
jgi:hypothetical protein